MVSEDCSFRTRWTILLALIGLFAREVRGDPVGKVISSEFSAAMQSGTSLAAVDGPVRAIVTLPDAIVVGSNALSVFDGERWERINLPETYAFRALAAAEWAGHERVYVGALGELGFIQRESTGHYHYHSFDAQLRFAGITVPTDVWNVFAIPRGAIWIATDRVIRATFGYRDEVRFESWLLPARSHLAGFEGDDGVRIYQDGIGLLKLGREGLPAMEIPDSALPQRPVEWTVRTKDGWLMGLGDSAYRLYRSEPYVFKRVARLSAALRNTLPTCAIEVGNDRVAIGTFGSGIFLSAGDDSPVQQFSSANGLSNNSVYALAQSGNSTWAGLGSGTLRLEGLGEADFFDRHESLGDGIPVKLGQRRSGAYALTSSGLFSLTADGPVPERGNGTVRVPLDTAEAANEFWTAGIGGLWRQSPEGPVKELFVSNDVSAVAPTSQWPNAVLFIEGYRIKLLAPSEHGGWAAHDLGAVVNDTPVSLLEDQDRRVWVTTFKDGIYGFDWFPSPDGTTPRLVLATHYRPGSGLPEVAARPLLKSARKILYAFTEQGILKLRKDRTAFEPVVALQDFIGIATTSGSSGSDLWLVKYRDLPAAAVIRVTSSAAGDVSWEGIKVPGIDRLGTVRSIETGIGGMLWIAGDQGILRFSTNGIGEKQASVPQLVAVNKTVIGKSPGFTWHSPDTLEGEKVFYSSHLAGAETDWSSPNLDSERRFTGLPPGRYSFQVRALDRWGQRGPIVDDAFTIPAPVWRQWPLLLAEAVALALAVACFVRWRMAGLRRRSEALEHLVSERTREIELASTAKSEFLENISHEIRNPLNGLTGLLRMMNEDRMGPAERDLARSLKAVAENLTRVFEDILEFSKLEYGYAKLNNRAFELRRLLEEITGLFSFLANQAKATLNVEVRNLESSELWLLGDDGKIRTILANFVANALKYAPGTLIQISVEIISERDEMLELIFDVADRGPGIPVAEQELIFKKFVRGSNAQDGQVAGTGLGLATCSVLARLLNGSVGVESSPGKGAAFYFRLLLPRTEAPQGVSPFPSPSTLSQVVRSTTPGPFKRAGRALIVDDEDYNRVVLEGIALELGYRPTPAGNAEDALTQFEGNDFAVVFLDWELPGRKGGDIAKVMRIIEQTSDAPKAVILATTAHDSLEMREYCRAAGMDGFLLKPLDAQQVNEAIGNAKAGFFTEGTAEQGDGQGLDERAFNYYRQAHSDAAAEAKLLYWQSIETINKLLTEAFERDDRVELESAAHRLRGLSGLVRATALNRAATELESAAKSKASVAQLEAIQKACVELKHQLRL